MKLFGQANKFFFSLSTAVIVFVSRLGFLPANISPLGSFGFFGQPVLYASTILAFDIFVKGLYPGFWITYLGFAAYPLLGKFSQHNLKKQVLYLPAASFLFFLISNFGVWWYWYDHTFSGLMTCYLLAIPFYTRTLIGDLLFGYGYLIVRHFNFLKSMILTNLSKIKLTTTP